MPIWVVAAQPILAPRHRNGTLTTCKRNLMLLGAAMEMYSVDWSGRYPPNMDYLTPNYLKTIPKCPGAGKISYSLETGLKARRNTEKSADYYFFMCRGENHRKFGLPKDYPQYNGTRGLMER